MYSLAVSDIMNAWTIEIVTKALGLEDLRTGRHARRDERGLRVDTLIVEKLWLAEIRPAFMNPACLAFFLIDKQQFAVFAIKEEPAARLFGPIEGDWIRPIARVMQHLDVWSANGGISLDGISYSLFTETRDAQFALCFTTPHVDSLKNLGEILLRLAERVSASDTTNTASDYVNKWMAYTTLEHSLNTS